MGYFCEKLLLIPLCVLDGCPHDSKLHLLTDEPLFLLSCCMKRESGGGGGGGLSKFRNKFLVWIIMTLSNSNEKNYCRFKIFHVCLISMLHFFTSCMTENSYILFFIFTFVVPNTENIIHRYYRGQFGGDHEI